jgi:hypothetical protein
MLKLFAAVMVLSLALLPGCGGHGSDATSSDSRSAIPECQAFLGAYEQCLSTLGPANVARERAAQTRTSLGEAAHGGEKARAELRDRCVANLAQLQMGCR